jgi:hypothetical protein
LDFGLGYDTVSKKLFCLLVILVGLPVCLQARDSGEPDVPWDKLRDTASRYLDACCTPKTVQSMEKKLKQRVEQRMQDNDTYSEDTCMRSFMLDWAASNEGNLKKKEKEAVTQACFYFVTFIDKGYLIPQQIRSRLTPDVVKEILDHLEGEIAKAKKK